MSRNPWAITDGKMLCFSVGINWRRTPVQGPTGFQGELPWLNSEVWDFHWSDMAWWGHRPESLSSWHKGHRLSAKSSFLRPTSPPILCCTLNRPFILSRTTPYHAWRQASSVCTETEKSLNEFFFFLRCSRPSGRLLANLPTTSAQQFEPVWKPSQALHTGLCYLSQNRLRVFAPTHPPSLFFCSISSGSMHSGFDAVAFPQGDGCCGVHEATGWHLHKKKRMLSDQRRKRGAEASVHSSYHITAPLIADSRQSFCQTGSRKGTWK